MFDLLQADDQSCFARTVCYLDGCFETEAVHKELERRTPALKTFLNQTKLGELSELRKTQATGQVLLFHQEEPPQTKS